MTVPGGDRAFENGQADASQAAAFEQPWENIDINQPNTWTKEVVKPPGQKVSVTVWELNNATS
jgi:hypothetical protein